MYRVLTASKDTYITNKIINNKFRATDANVGQAGTLDLFKLYSESTLSGTSAPSELSRILIKFDLDPLKKVTSSYLDTGHGSFRATLKLFDVYGGQTTPSNFKLIVFPLSRSFDEGIGRDIITFEDLDASNFITASISGDTAVAWNMTGANRQGLLGSTKADIISSGNLSDGEGTTSFIYKTQSFSIGNEDLSVDVTRIVSATLANQIPDHGFRISFSGSQETDKITRFVKRFASRDAQSVHKRPKLVIEYNDTIQDHHESFFFNLSGSIFLNNFHRGEPANILSESKGRFVGVSGSNCVVVRLVSGSDSNSSYFAKTITGSQHQVGDNYITGVYSASFSISEFASATLRSEILAASSATFSTYWGSTDYTVGYHTGSLVINAIERTSFSNVPKRLFINITNSRDVYKSSEKVRFRVFAEDVDRITKLVKKPIEPASEIFTQMYYRIRDTVSNDVVVPFGEDVNSTLLSTDSVGMYFDFYMDTLPEGRTYTVDFLVKDSGSSQIYTDSPIKFKVLTNG